MSPAAPPRPPAQGGVALQPQLQADDVSSSTSTSEPVATTPLPATHYATQMKSICLYCFASVISAGQSLSALAKLLAHLSSPHLHRNSILLCIALACSATTNVLLHLLHLLPSTWASRFSQAAQVDWTLAHFLPIPFNLTMSRLINFAVSRASWTGHFSFVLVLATFIDLPPAHSLLQFLVMLPFFSFLQVLESCHAAAVAAAPPACTIQATPQLGSNSDAIPCLTASALPFTNTSTDGVSHLLSWCHSEGHLRKALIVELPASIACLAAALIFPIILFSMHRKRVTSALVTSSTKAAGAAAGVPDPSPPPAMPLESLGVHVVSALGLRRPLLAAVQLLELLAGSVTESLLVRLVCFPLCGYYMLVLILSRHSILSSERQFSTDEILLIMVLFFLSGRESCKLDIIPFLAQSQSRLKAAKVLLSDLLPGHLVAALITQEREDDLSRHNSAHHGREASEGQVQLSGPEDERQTQSMSASSARQVLLGGGGGPQSRQLCRSSGGGAADALPPRRRASSSSTPPLAPSQPRGRGGISPKLSLQPAAGDSLRQAQAVDSHVRCSAEHERACDGGAEQAVLDAASPGPSGAVSTAAGRRTPDRSRPPGAQANPAGTPASRVRSASTPLGNLQIPLQQLMVSLHLMEPSSAARREPELPAEPEELLPEELRLGLGSSQSHQRSSGAEATDPLGQRPRLKMAEAHDCLTLFFSDICGFSTWAHKLSPDKVMRTLNDLYIRLDDILIHEMPSLYKVETIGDAYMVAGNLTEQDPAHAATMVRFALRAQQEAAKVPRPDMDDGTPLQMRIGLHSGPAMSGIVGKLRRRFCIFGDTVNMCSRTETTCPEGCVQVTADTHALAMPYLSNSEVMFQERGEVQLKGAEQPKMMFLAQTRS